MFEYFSPHSLTNVFRDKPSYLLIETGLDAITLTGGLYHTKAIDYTSYKMFERNQCFMRVSVEINNNSVLTDADTLEIFVESGLAVDVGNKITSPVNIPDITFESDKFFGKKVALNTIDNKYPDYDQYVSAEKVIISKDSFAMQNDNTFYVSKHIAFPIWNSSVKANKQTGFNPYYAVNFKPNGAFVGNANVKVSVQFLEMKMDMGAIGSIAKKAMM
jgi:hypothetical protein